MGYSAADIVGKTLRARTRVPFKLSAWDDAPVAGYFQPGQVIGVVDSWLDPQNGRSILMWVFISPNGSWYYVEHRGEYFDLESLRAQGVTTTEEQAAAAANASLTPVERSIQAVTRAVTGGILVWFGFKGLGALMRSGRRPRYY